MRNLNYLLIAFSMLFLAACSNSDDAPSLNQFIVQLTSEESGVNFGSFQVKLSEQRSGATYNAVPDAQGKAVFAVPLGQYDIVAEDPVNGVSTMYGSVQNYTLSQNNATVSIPVKSVQSALEKTFLLDELFFNCSSNSDGSNNYYEEYFTIKNVSNRPLYADGLSVAVCGDYNALDQQSQMSAFLPDTLVVSQVYTIPGNGREHVVQPGQSLVIAHSAINHSQAEGKEAARDLSGADFEIYVPYEYTMTTDNAEVTNLTVNFSTFQAFSWGYAGHAPMVLFRAKGDVQSYVDAHKQQFPVTGSMGRMKQDYIKIPAAWVVDGVETGSKDNLFHKVLPNSIDRGSILIDDTGMYGGFHGQFVQRKPAATGYLQDTNNSADDFVVVPNGQKNYPKKK